MDCPIRIAIAALALMLPLQQSRRPFQGALVMALSQITDRLVR
jgi:hypothetical protein